MEYHRIKDAQGLFEDDLDEWLPIVRCDKRKVHFCFHEVIVILLFCLNQYPSPLSQCPKCYIIIQMHHMWGFSFQPSVCPLVVLKSLASTYFVMWPLASNFTCSFSIHLGLLQLCNLSFEDVLLEASGIHNTFNILRRGNNTINHVRAMEVILSTYLALQLSLEKRCYCGDVLNGCSGTNYNKGSTSFGITEQNTK